MDSLPDAQSPSLNLDHPTDQENNAIWTLTASAWKDALPVDAYLRQSAYLMTVPLAKDGGMTQWVLVEKAAAPGKRLLLSSCETFYKRSWVRDRNGNVTSVITHGVASVYTDLKYRGRGYASRLMSELARVLPTWQIDKSEQVRCVASVLFSDIGKGFYRRLGWHPFPSYHIEFAPAIGDSLSAGATARPLLARDLEQLCKEDEALAQKALATPTTESNKTRFMIVPDHAHILWHHSNEEYVTQTLFQKKPQVKGAIIGEPGNRVWVVWTHRFYEPPSDSVSTNTLYILRLVIENWAVLSGETGEQYGLQVNNLRTVILAAVAEAAEWGLHRVKLWGPSIQVQKLIKQTGVPHRLEDRGEDGICSLRWYGEGSGQEDEIEWIGNEKYGWC
ncbi:Acetyltransferase GNAT domain protein [Aspergillus parasiticus SU-1]|uniref:Acetyltransferase GNAT domain protein n=1 Tax=Aspergillus parasiticus (strain ATCC 56775 / NRRL 5862 / SRRC 143 / SU-1) TaxID=1403190 RepID=A0A0F0INY7_ASPPU|nr:Acetyltransferase GNAT domain protein [Aspergillus parasiticus SU-1]